MLPMLKILKISENFCGVRTQMVYFSSEFVRKSTSRSKRLFLCALCSFFGNFPRVSPTIFFNCVSKPYLLRLDTFVRIFFGVRAQMVHFSFGICFEIQFPDYKDCSTSYYVPVIEFFGHLIL